MHLWLSWIEHQTTNLGVGGSNPSRCAILSAKLLKTLRIPKIRRLDPTRHPPGCPTCLVRVARRPAYLRLVRDHEQEQRFLHPSCPRIPKPKANRGLRQKLSLSSSPPCLACSKPWLGWYPQGYRIIKRAQRGLDGRSASNAGRTVGLGHRGQGEHRGPDGPAGV